MTVMTTDDIKLSSKLFVWFTFCFDVLGPGAD